MGPRPISRLCWPGPARRICRYTIPGRGGISTARSKKPMFVTATNFSNAFVCGKPCRGLDPYCFRIRSHAKRLTSEQYPGSSEYARGKAAGSGHTRTIPVTAVGDGDSQENAKKITRNPMKIPRFYLENHQKNVEKCKNCDFYVISSTHNLFVKYE